MAVPNGYIISAYYGAIPSETSPGFNDVTALVTAQFGVGDRTFAANNATYGPEPDHDPAPGVKKTLLITYAWTGAAAIAPGIYPLDSYSTNTVAIPENKSGTLPHIKP